jgi:hypothetical protein
MQKRFLKKNNGSIESFLTILPQIAVFLISLQLILMQMIRSTNSYLSNDQSISSSVSSATESQLISTPLIGGGEILSLRNTVNQSSFSRLLYGIKSQNFSIVINESKIR